jgi:hypothetical protein
MRMVEGGAPERQRPNRNEKIALRKLLSGNRVTELRNVRTLAYRIKCKRKSDEGDRTEVDRRIRTIFHVGSVGY